MKTVKLYQVYDIDLDGERFCFNAKNEENAKDKLRGWLSYHGYLGLINNFKLSEVSEPYYHGNIHNDWV